ncbi:jg26436, partial [Pararge aegeria aegeria]
MVPTMLTRRAAALQEQLKLKNALSELKSLKQLNADLMREQDDSEVELRSIIAKNSQLKGELADLHSAHTLVLEERNQLQEAVHSFNQCISTYDEALGRITMLEGELCSAHKTID